MLPVVVISLSPLTTSLCISGFVDDVMFSVIGESKATLTCRYMGYSKAPFFNTYRAYLVGVYAFLIWNNLCDLVYETPTKSYQSQIPVAFGIPGHVTTKHLPDTPC